MKATGRRGRSIRPAPLAGGLRIAKSRAFPFVGLDLLAFSRGALQIEPHFQQEEKDFRLTGGARRGQQVYVIWKNRRVIRIVH